MKVSELQTYQHDKHIGRLIFFAQNNITTTVSPHETEVMSTITSVMGIHALHTLLH